MDVEESFRAYARARTTALTRIAFLLTADQHLAEDLVQETLLRVAGRWRTITSGGDPDPYVRKVLYHQHLAQARRRRIHAILLARPPERPGPDEPATIARRVAVHAALASLAPRQRAVLVLRYFEDHTEAETAEILGCRVGTVKSQSRDALARLRLIAPHLADSTDGGPRPDVVPAPTGPTRRRAAVAELSAEEACR